MATDQRLYRVTPDGPGRVDVHDYAGQVVGQLRRICGTWSWRALWGVLFGDIPGQEPGWTGTHRTRAQALAELLRSEGLDVAENEERVTVRSAATGLHRTVAVRWRTQRVVCCDLQQPIVWGARRRPYAVDGSYGAVVDAPAQCPGCGALHVASYTVEEVGS